MSAVVSVFVEAVVEIRATQRVLPKAWRLEALGPTGTEVVADVEALCVGVIAETARRQGRTLETVDRDDLGYLLERVVVLVGKYDPRRTYAAGALRGFLFDRLRFALLDEWERQRRRASRELLESGAVADGDVELSRPEEAAADPADDWIAALGGLDAARDRSAPEGIRGPGLAARGGAPRGDARGGLSAPGRDVATARGAGTPAPFVDCERCGWRTYRQAPNGQPGWHFAESCLGCGGSLLGRAEERRLERASVAEPLAEIAA